MTAEQSAPFLLCHLVADDLDHRRAAWDRLRSVCVDLQLSPPTFKQVQEQQLCAPPAPPPPPRGSKMIPDYEPNPGAGAKMYVGDLSATVICRDESGYDTPVDYDIGCRLE